MANNPKENHPNSASKVKPTNNDELNHSYYHKSYELIKDELSLHDLKLYLSFLQFKKSTFEKELGDLSGFILSDEHVEDILYQSFYNILQKFDPNFYNIDTVEFDGKHKVNNEPIKRPEIDKNINGVLFLINKLENIIKEKKQYSLNKNIFLPLHNLPINFDLLDYEYYIIIVCLAFELDTKYEKIYAYLQDDISKKRPTIELILRIFDLDFNDKIKTMNNLRNSPLFENNIIEYFENQTGIMSRTLKINDSILAFIVNEGKPDKNIHDALTLYLNQTLIIDKEQRKVPTLNSLEPVQKFLINYLKDLNSPYPSTLILLIGKANSGRKTLVKNTITDLNLNYSLIVVDLKNLKNATSGVIKEIINSAKINSILYKAIIYFDNFEEMLNLGEQNGESKGAIKLLINEINNILEKNIGSIFFAVNEKNKEDILTTFHHFINDHNHIEIKIPELTQEDRIRIWKTYLVDHNVNLKDEEILYLSTKFSFTVGQIRDSVKKSIPISILNNSGARHSHVSIEDIYEACYEVSNKKLDSIATSMKSQFCLDDIVLPSNGKKNLIDILNYIKNQTYIFDTWGFQRKMGLKKGVNILFSGESGTGKTMAAQIIANELKLKIYKVDYSMLISKFIGETEKNTNKIFEEAKTSNAIIFFDEADAIFGKRTEIKDSHDRYANIEVNYLLQKLEEHDEIVILASNLKQNIDEAFVRRMQFIVEFSFPTENERLIMWKNIFPLPSFYIDTQSIDFDFLAKSFKISGSMIKNIALTSAFIAFSEPNFDPQNMKISMRHIILAVKKEMDKKGKPILKADFGPYSDLLS